MNNIISGLALAVSVVALFQSRKANKLSEESNQCINDSNLIAREANKIAMNNNRVAALTGIRINATLKSIESDSGYWQEDLIENAIYNGIVKLVFCVENWSNKDLLSVTFDKYDNKLDEQGDRIPKGSSVDLCTTLPLWDKDRVETDVTLSDGKIVSCKKRLFWQFDVFVCSCEVEFKVLIKREQDLTKYNKWTLSPHREGSCKTSDYELREAI